MEVSFKKENEVLLVMPIGKIDSVNAGDLQADIQSQITDEITNVRIDMSNIAYVSSKGIRILLIIHRQMLEKGKLVLFNLNNSVKEVLRLSALLKTFNIE